MQSIHTLARTPEDIAALSKKQKKSFIHMFRDLDHDFARLKAFSNYEESMLQEYGFSEKEYESYAAMYKNVMEELSAFLFEYGGMNTGLIEMLLQSWVELF